ncbi:MAG: cytochrome c [Clostridia bacterium]|nr:cytochrome c [Clostridia bacterium]
MNDLLLTLLAVTGVAALAAGFLRRRRGMAGAPPLLLLGVAALAFAGAGLVGGLRAGGPGQGPAPSAQVALGEQIFQQGIGADGRPIARSGGFPMMMGGALSCASCHGPDGRGRRTMMFTAPDITYGNLTDPRGMLEADGRRGMRYTDALIARAVTQGLDAEGKPLDPVMPRWQLTPDEVNALIAYLKTLH